MVLHLQITLMENIGVHMQWIAVVATIFVRQSILNHTHALCTYAGRFLSLLVKEDAVSVMLLANIVSNSTNRLSFSNVLYTFSVCCDGFFNIFEKIFILL